MSAQNFGAIGASSIADDQSRSDSKDGASNDHDFQIIPFKFQGKKFMDQDHGERKDDDGKDHVDDKRFADRAVGQVDKGQIDENKKEGNIFRVSQSCRKSWPSRLCRRRSGSWG